MRDGRFTGEILLFEPTALRILRPAAKNRRHPLRPPLECGDGTARPAPMFFLRPILLLLTPCVIPRAHAHLPGESSLVLSLDAENLGVLVSLSLPTAATLLAPESQPLSAATLDRRRPELLAAASRVCALLDAEDKPLEPERVLVSVFQDHEVRFHLLFAPGARPARLRMPLLGILRGETFCTLTDLRDEPPVRALLTPDASVHTFSR